MSAATINQVVVALKFAANMGVLVQVNQQINKTNSALKTLKQAANSSVGQLTLLTGSFVGLTKMASKFADTMERDILTSSNLFIQAGNNAYYMAGGIGEAVDNLTALQKAVMSFGGRRSEADALAQLIGKMQMEAQRGGLAGMEGMGQLRILSSDVKGKSVEEIANLLVERLSKMPHQVRMQIAKDLGLEPGLFMLQMDEAKAKDFSRMLGEGIKKEGFGQTVFTETVEMQKSLNELNNAFRELGKVLIQFTPLLTAVIKALTIALDVIAHPIDKIIIDPVSKIIDKIEPLPDHSIGSMLESGFSGIDRGNKESNVNIKIQAEKGTTVEADTEDNINIEIQETQQMNQ